MQDFKRDSCRRSSVGTRLLWWGSRQGHLWTLPSTCPWLGRYAVLDTVHRDTFCTGKANNPIAQKEILGRCSEQCRAHIERKRKHSVLTRWICDRHCPLDELRCRLLKMMATVELNCSNEVSKNRGALNSLGTQSPGYHVKEGKLLLPRLKRLKKTRFLCCVWNVDRGKCNL